MLPSGPTSSPMGFVKMFDAGFTAFPMKVPPAVYLETKEVQPWAVTPKFDTQKLPALSKVIPEGQLRPLSPGGMKTGSGVSVAVNLSTPGLGTALKFVAYTVPSGPTRMSCEAVVDTELNSAWVDVL